MSRLRRCIPFVIALLPGLALAPVAASQTVAPKGNSAIHEYLETAPGAAGDVRPLPPPSRAANAPGLGVSASRPGERAQRSRRADGAPTTPTGTRSLSAGASEGRSPASATLAAVSGGEDGSALGLLLPVLLFATALGATGVMAARRRRRRGAE